MTSSSNYSEEALFARDSLFRQKLSQLRNTGEIRRMTLLSTQAGLKEMERSFYLNNADSAFVHSDPRQLEKLALLDSKTEFYNHDTISRLLKNEVKRCHRYQRELSVLAITIDSSSQIEQKIGPIAYDSFLKSVAQLLMQTIRDVDLPGKYDRDRLILICPETPLNGALLLAQRLCQCVREKKLLEVERSTSVTLSIGIASFGAPAENDEQLLLLAMQALKLVEQSGGNNYGAIKNKTIKTSQQ